MKIISHRGYWLEPEEKNSRAAFHRSLAVGFGTETDVRDRDGELVVSHDPATGSAMPWSELLAMFEPTGLPLAVNIKADGLSALLAKAFEGSALPWFAFDMSGPEMFRYAAANLPFYTRHSDIEQAPLLYDKAQGVWLDSFGPEWFDADTVRAHLNQGKQVCIVSSDLHGRDPAGLWAKLSSLNNDAGVTLCTDFPERAREFFEQ